MCYNRAEHPVPLRVETMARILFGIIPAWGHINPTLAIAQLLQEAGHTVAYACHAEMAPAFQQAGLELLDGFRWGDPLLDIRRQAHQPRRRRLPSPGLVIHGLRDIFFGGLEQAASDLITVVRSWRPDVMLFDSLFPPGPIAAEVCQVPYATSNAVIPWQTSLNVPPAQLGLPPRGRPHWAWPIARSVLDRSARGADRLVNDVRRRHGLPPVRRAFLQPSPYLGLLYATEAFDYTQPDAPPHLYYVGPSISRHRFDSALPFPLDWLDGRPAFYTSLGTLYGVIPFFDMVIEACREQPWQMVLSVGPHLDPARWKDAPQNVLVRNWVPVVQILPYMSAVLSHGGSNTLAEALSASLPIGVVPRGADQFDNARRVAETGAGLFVYPHMVTMEALRGLCHRLLKDDVCRENARRIARDYARCDGPGTAAALLVRLAQTRAPLPRPAGRRPTVYAGEAGTLDHPLTPAAVGTAAP